MMHVNTFATWGHPKQPFEVAAFFPLRWASCTNQERRTQVHGVYAIRLSDSAVGVYNSFAMEFVPSNYVSFHNQSQQAWQGTFIPHCFDVDLNEQFYDNTMRASTGDMRILPSKWNTMHPVKDDAHNVVAVPVEDVIDLTCNEILETDLEAKNGPLDKYVDDIYSHVFSAEDAEDIPDEIFVEELLAILSD